jgi:tRNA(Ile)-lysidine synthase
MAARSREDIETFVVGEVSRRLEPYREARVVVAVSGGGDSVGLLRALESIRHDFALELSIAHLHHGVRGEAADADAHFVQDLAQRLRMPFDLGHWTPHRSGHFEADARRARLAWLESVADGRSAVVLALGHTRDDQAETVLHRILRGTGLRGLAGIPSSRRLPGGALLLRPLLDIGRSELRSYLDRIGQGFREDESNTDPTHLRSRLRHRLLPHLAEEYNPRIAESLVRLARLAEAADRTLRDAVREACAAATCERDADHIALERGVLARLDPFLRAELLRLLWRRQAWSEVAMSAARWERLAALAIQSTGRWDVGAGVTLVATPNRVTLSRASV